MDRQIFLLARIVYKHCMYKSRGFWYVCGVENGVKTIQKESKVRAIVRSHGIYTLEIRRTLVVFQTA